MVVPMAFKQKSLNAIPEVDDDKLTPDARTVIP